MTREAALFWMVLAVGTGCRSSLEEHEFACGRPAIGTAGLTVRSAATPSGASRYGAVMVRVGLGLEARPPISGVGVSVHPDTTLSTTGDAIRSGVTDEQGWTLLDSIAPGHYALLIRRIGFEAIRQPIAMRPGYVDTVEAAMRTSPFCLTLHVQAT